MAPKIAGLFSPYPSDLIPQANAALAINVKNDPQPQPQPESQYNKWFSLKTINHIPAYIFLAGSVGGVVILIAAVHFNNHLAMASASLFTVASLAGAYYCYKFTTMKPLIDLVGQLTKKVQEIEAVRKAIQVTIDQYKELEKKLKADNDQLGKQVNDESNLVKMTKEDFDNRNLKMQELVAKINTSEKQLENYQSICDSLKAQLAGLSHDLDAYNQTSGLIDKNINALNKNSGAIEAAEGQIKIDEGKLENDNQQLQSLQKQFSDGFSGLKNAIATLQESYKKASEALAQQKALLNQMGDELAGLQSAANTEAHSSNELGGVADKLEQQMKQVSVLVKLIPLIQTWQNQQKQQPANP